MPADPWLAVFCCVCRAADGQHPLTVGSISKPIHLTPSDRAACCSQITCRNAGMSLSRWMLSEAEMILKVIFFMWQIKMRLVYSKMIHKNDHSL